ncbi:PBSX family phage terminase large subunit [Methylorubrum extorquens]|uniref:Phage terminase, large subunit, PBSX n=1 Tax=Methylorubrum extorquens (strain ATCC 14718 / DSM 1338 / JCM 2805 / NCIMB 9133 / AM1) TaxID=272630 RepID=C5B0T0_METEA|nr:PBSX family phage terminase large subunit [Methylorubrum extorquens]ACS41667.1 Phage terminase, large subunit, PBSX [Methylorubrum extorquens AM1]MCP1545319.1 phage terminase large subunit [Methylorubrum extorquens]MCP1587334.1 phage terminase large subunit [Methylorubrum extorquens]
MNVEFPEKLAFLFESHRYKVLHGGRGGSKSWGAARALIIQAATKPMRVLCAREFQNSINESVHQLLSNQIEELGLRSAFEIQDKRIIGLNGSEFIFSGLRHKIDSLKSTEGIDVCWVEEAQTVSNASWSKLIPTIRKDGSEIWVTFNPELDTDPTYQRFVVNPPADAKVVRLNWSDNPWFPEVLRREKDELAARDPDAYLNVWEGATRQTLDGAVYAKEMREAAAEGRIGRVQYDRTKPVHTAWDLGWADCTSIWFAQAVGGEFRVIDFLEVSQRAIPDIVKTLQSKGYVYGNDYLPHDADSSTLQGNGRTIAQMMRSLGRNVIVQPRRDVIEGINAARTLFPQFWFDEQKCADGLNHLRHYRYDVDPDTKQFSRKPLHDQHSHAADSFRYLAMSLRGDTKREKVKPPIRIGYAASNTAWMG